MRSSVSAILSDPAPDTTMSFPDYSQSSSDHATLLVLCQHIGHQLDLGTYNTVVDLISKVQEVKVSDGNGSVRCVRVRYADRYPAENNEWGEFQVKKKSFYIFSKSEQVSFSQATNSCVRAVSKCKCYLLCSSAVVPFLIVAQGVKSDDNFNIRGGSSSTVNVMQSS